MLNFDSVRELEIHDVASACLMNSVRTRDVQLEWARTSLSSGQRNMSQHSWAKHVAYVWPSCCDMLGVVGSNLTIFKSEPTTPNMSQHIATRWANARNMLRPTMLRHVALACCERLAGASRSFPTFTLRILSAQSLWRHLARTRARA